MKLLRGYQSNEIVVRNSRFLAEAFPANDPEEAREILRGRKSRFSDSSHVVHAFVVGPEGNILGCSDDGEPPGTAGRPALEVLKGSGITNAIVTITRWFGGVKLGTGGLVRAYSESVREVLRKAETCHAAARSDFSVQVDYPIYEAVRRILRELEAIDVEATFGDRITITGRLEDQRLEILRDQVRDLSRGRSSVRPSEGEK